MQSHYKEVPFVIFGLVWLFQLSCSHPFMEYGVVYANGGTFRFVGESLELYCNITNKDLRENSSMLHMEKVTKQEQSIISAEHIEILTTKAIRLRLRILDIDDDGVYTCFQETFSGESRVIGFQTIKVDYEPQKVKDISCRVYNWEQMKCTWDLGASFQHPEFIKISLVWTIHGEQQDCPSLTNTSCVWDSRVYAHGYQYLMIVEIATVVEGKNLVTVRSPQFRIDTALHVEPAPVNNLQATVDSSTCIDLTWQHTSVDWQKFFVAESRFKGEEKWHQIILNQEQEQADYHSPVCGLTPFTDYEFRMSVLPFPVETEEPVVQGYKSEWKMVSAKTLEDVPGAAPKLCSGCFFEYKCPDSRQQRCVRLYWQKLKDSEKHGILTRYNVTYINTKTGVTETSLMPITESTQLHSADINLPTPRQSFKIVIRPGTSQGFSRKYSSLLLPSVHRKPSPPQNFLVEWEESEDNTKYKFYLSWAALNSESKDGMKYTSVSVVWCCGHWTTAECENDINWVKMPADQVTYELQPGSADCHYSNFLIGITAEALHASHVTNSGIHWSSCVYLRNQKPQNTPRNVRQSSAHPVNGLTILWDSFGCVEETSYITEYLIRYCPLNEDNTCMEADKTLNISNTINQMTLDGLKQNVKYKVRVIAVSSAGLGPSEPLITQPVKGSPLPDPEFNTTVGIIVGISSFMILLGLVLALWRYCLFWKKKLTNMENLIQPYAQASENYSPQKPQDIRNRPLPKTPEDQHFYGSSACMNTHGSETVKNYRHSESISEHSTTSRTSLLLNLLHTSQSPPPTSKSGIKANKKNSDINTSKEKHKSVRKLKTLLNLKSSATTNDSSQVFSEGESPNLKNRSSASYSKFKQLNKSLSAATDCQSVDGHHCLNTALNIQPSSRSLTRLQQGIIRNSGDSFMESELNDSSLITFSKVSTLSVRKCGMKLPVCPLKAKLQTQNTCSASMCENHMMLADVGQGVPVFRNSVHDWRHYPPPQHFHSVIPATENLQMSSYFNYPLCPKKCMTLNNMADMKPVKRTSFLCQCNNVPDCTKIVETSECKRHSVPLASFLHFPPPPTSPPPVLYPGEIHAPTGLSTTLPHHLPMSISHGCQCRLSLRSIGDQDFSISPAAFTDSNGYFHHEPFFTTLPASDTIMPVPCVATTQYKERNAQSSFALNVSPVNNCAMYTDNPPHIKSLSNDGIISTVEDYRYNPAVSAQTFPRNTAGKDSLTLQLPSPLTRPLSGDLLDLPPEYYQDPRLDGSHLILTEL